MHFHLNLNFCNFFPVAKSILQFISIWHFLLGFEEMKAEKGEMRTKLCEVMLCCFSCLSNRSIHTLKKGELLLWLWILLPVEAKRGQIPSMHFKALTQSLFFHYFRIHSYFGILQLFLNHCSSKVVVVLITFSVEVGQ